MLGKTLQSTDNEKYKIFIDMVNSGNFYNRIYTKMYPDKPYDRSIAKLMILIYFFSSNRSRAEFKKDFKNTLPAVHKLFALLKKKNHRALSHLLQRIESEIIIERVTKRISREKPDLPIFTIHDSVVTIQGNENYVARIIKEEVQKAKKLDVKLGLEYWNP